MRAGWPVQRGCAALAGSLRADLAFDSRARHARLFGRDSLRLGAHLHLEAPAAPIDQERDFFADRRFFDQGLKLPQPEELAAVGTDDPVARRKPAAAAAVPGVTSLMITGSGPPNGRPGITRAGSICTPRNPRRTCPKSSRSAAIRRARVAGIT